MTSDGGNGLAKRAKRANRAKRAKRFFVLAPQKLGLRGNGWYHVNLDINNYPMVYNLWVYDL